jgi:hypothetical protein
MSTISLRRLGDFVIFSALALAVIWPGLSKPSPSGRVGQLGAKGRSALASVEQRLNASRAYDAQACTSTAIPARDVGREHEPSQHEGDPQEQRSSPVTSTHAQASPG